MRRDWGKYDEDEDNELYQKADKKANKKINAITKKSKLNPLDASHLSGIAITKTFWGTAWCKHLESFSDLSNRLPRGRSYVRGGSIIHLEIAKGKIEAIVSGNANYLIDIKIKTIPTKKYEYIKNQCTGKINSLLELLDGKLSNEVMSLITQKNEGLFPLPGEMTFSCTCPDWASMCKHIACTLYGVGVLLDKCPELIFKLRGVDHKDLIQGEAMAAINKAVDSGSRRREFIGDIREIFDIDVNLKGAKPLKKASPPKKKK